MFCCREPSPAWRRPSPPISAVAAATKATSSGRSYTCFKLFKPATVFCCINGPDDYSSPLTSASSSYSSRWYNPLGSRRLDEPAELLRHWVDADAVSAPSLLSEERVVVMSYNILGDRNAFKHRDLYRNVPSVYLKWDRRKRVICEEIIAWNPDIICLQEVDKYYDLSSMMRKAGYAGSYKRRTGDNADGCAMFWKPDKFRRLEKESIEFRCYNLHDNVAQLSVFEMCRAESRRLIVGNIHVLYNPRRGDVKLGQIRLLSSRAQILSEKWGNVPVVLGGDFNSTPESAIYEFLKSSQLNIMLYDRRELSGQKSCQPAQVLDVKIENGCPFLSRDRFWKYCWTDEEVRVATGINGRRIAEHPLKLSSSYAKVRGSARTRTSGGEPVATTYHAKFLGTVDYLWYSHGLSPTRVLDTIPIDVLQKTGGLPCNNMASDHLALVCEFAFIQSSNEGNKTKKHEPFVDFLTSEEDESSKA